MSVASGSQAFVRIARIRRADTGEELNQYAATCKVEVQNKYGTTTYAETPMTADATAWTHEIPATAFTYKAGPWTLIYRIYSNPGGVLLRTLTVEEADINV